MLMIFVCALMRVKIEKGWGSANKEKYEREAAASLTYSQSTGQTIRESP
jgi:hypothetical protein